jgi:hypothetical protein
LHPTRALGLVRDQQRLTDRPGRVTVHGVHQLGVRTDLGDFDLGLAHPPYQFVLQCDDLLDLLVREHDRFEHDVFRKLGRLALDHHDRIARAGHHHVQRAPLQFRERRRDDEPVVDASDTDAGNRPLERRGGDGQRRRRADDPKTVRHVALIGGQH